MNGKKGHFRPLQIKKGRKAEGEVGVQKPKIPPGVLNMQSESKKLLLPKTFLFYENPRVNEWNLGPIFFTNFGAKNFFEKCKRCKKWGIGD